MKKLLKKWWFWLIVVVVVLIGIGGAGQGDEAAETRALPAADVADTPEPTATAMPTPKPTPYRVWGLSADRTVYVSNAGKIHLKSDCSGMKTYTEMTLEEAYNAGYEKCERCW